MRILITGHRGFIGSYLFKELGKEFRVFGIDKGIYEKPKRNEVIHNLEYKLDLWNFNCEKVYSFIRKADVIIHCAAIVGVDNHISSVGSFLENWEIDKNLISLLKPTQKLIYLSSSEVYGDSKETLSCKSNLNFSVEKRSNYGLEKLFAERFIEATHPNFVILRPFNIVGNSNTQTKGVFREFFDRATRNKDIVIYKKDGNISSRVFLSIDDFYKAVRGIIGDFETFKGKIFNVNNVFTENTSILELAEKFKKKLNSNSKIVFEEPRKNDNLILNRNPENPEIFKILGIKSLKKLDTLIDDFIKD